MGSQNSKWEVLANFSFRGRGYSWVVKTQSGKFWPTFNLVGGYSWVVKTQCGKFWSTFNFGGRGILG